VVNDDGNGIPARHSLDSTIYWKNIREERQWLVSALESGSSVKLRSQDTVVRGDPGYGFNKIISSFTGLQAFALLRTGRSEAFFDSTLGMTGFKINDITLGYMPGTALQVVFPVIPANLFTATR
jgi:hypothetical protein